LARRGQRLLIGGLSDDPVLLGQPLGLPLLVQDHLPAVAGRNVAFDTVSHQRALALRENFSDALANRATLLAKLNRVAEAMVEFRKAIQHDPESHFAYLNMGITLTHVGAYEEALLAYQTTLDLRKEYPAAYLHRGITLAKMDRLEDALQSHNKAIELRPNYAAAYFFAGNTLLMLARYEEAVELIDRSIELDPSNVNAYIKLGYEYFRRRIFEKALKEFDRAIDIDPNSSSAHCARGAILANLGRQGELARLVGNCNAETQERNPVGLPCPKCKRPCRNKAP